jgi:hypothetical protein
VDFAYHLGYDYVIGQMVRVVGTINDYTPEELAKIAVLTEIFRDSGGTNPLFIGKAKFFPGHRRHQTEWAYRRPTFENEKVFKTLDEAIWDALHLETAERQKLFTAS